MGPMFISSRSPILSRTTALLYGHRVPRGFSALPALPLDARIPHTKGKVTPAGIADLLVVKQTLKRYEAADIAHVENVLKGESKQRTHTKTTRTETTVFTETEATKDEEHELASTTRFEMAKETSNTINEDASLKADLKVSAKYGPAVSVDTSVEGSVSRSKEEVTKAASKYSQDVTERTVKKITERILQRRSTTTIVSYFLCLHCTYKSPFSTSERDCGSESAWYKQCDRNRSYFGRVPVAQQKVTTPSLMFLTHI